MFLKTARSDWIITLYTIAIGAVGAVLAYYLSFPVYVLTGPAILVSMISLTGLKFAITPTVRDIAFLLIGIGIGAGVTSEATAAVLRWPLAIGALAVMLLVIILLCQFLLVRFFNFDRRSAVLAATPGHLSFVIGLGDALGLDVARVAVVQSIRLLALTLLVPLVAILFGIKLGTNILPAGISMQGVHLLGLIAISVVAGLILKRLNVPAAILIGAMLTSGVFHAVDLTPGVLSPSIAWPCFLVIGTMIGTRFSGISFMQLKNALLAGLTTTAVSISLTVVVAIPIAYFLTIPTAHVVVAFSPGGLETMIAMGAVLGANPGFVAACHIGRLLLLPLLVPALLAKRK